MHRVGIFFLFAAAFLARFSDVIVELGLFAHLDQLVQLRPARRRILLENCLIRLECAEQARKGDGLFVLALSGCSIMNAVLESTI